MAATTLRNWTDFTWEPIHHWLKLCGWPLALAAAAFPLLRRRRPTGRTVVLLAGVVAGYLGVVYVHSLGKGFFVGRYMLPAVVAAMPIAAATLDTIVRWVRAGLVGRGWSGRRAALLCTTGLVVALSPNLVGMLLPIPSKALSILQAADWLHSHSGPNDLVFTGEERIAFYAQRPLRLYQPFRFDREYRDKQDYRSATFIALYYYKGEEHLMDRFFRFLEGTKRPLPELVETIAPPHTYPVRIYRPVR